MLIEKPVLCDKLSPVLPAVGLVVVAAEPLPAAAVPLSVLVVLVVLLVVVVEGRDGGRSVLLVSRGAEKEGEISNFGDYLSPRFGLGFGIFSTCECWCIIF